jgi:hypothetical protein
MAYTVTRYKSVFGNKRIVGLEITADAATQTVETGLSKIEWSAIHLQSMNTIVGVKIAVNSIASGVQSMGVLGISGVSSGDKFYVTVYGS